PSSGPPYKGYPSDPSSSESEFEVERILIEPIDEDLEEKISNRQKGKQKEDVHDGQSARSEKAPNTGNSSIERPVLEPGTTHVTVSLGPGPPQNAGNSESPATQPSLPSSSRTLDIAESSRFTRATPPHFSSSSTPRDPIRKAEQENEGNESEERIRKWKDKGKWKA
ncbi:hypothetical protein V5O48_019662, partial [Marasmius crinis-equi]